MSPSPGARGGSMYPLINETGRVAVRRRLITSTKDPSRARDGFVDWKPFDHPQLGRVEIGDWKEKFTWRNPPPKFLEEECERTGTFMLMYRALTPRIKLTRVEAEEVAPGMFKVSGVVKNRGFLPSNITEQAKTAKIAKKVTMEIKLGEGAELVMGRGKLELDHLEGRSDKIPGRFYTPLGPKRDPPGRFYGARALWTHLETCE